MNQTAYDIADDEIRNDLDPSFSTFYGTNHSLASTIGRFKVSLIFFKILLLYEISLESYIVDSVVVKISKLILIEQISIQNYCLVHIKSQINEQMLL